MLWADRIALGFLELLFLAFLLTGAIGFLNSLFSVSADRVYGVFIAGAFLIILPLWWVARIAESRARRRRSSRGRR